MAIENCLQKKIIAKEIRIKIVMTANTSIDLLARSLAVQCLFSQIMLVGSVDSLKIKSEPKN
jgi:hypothetical protein